MAAREEIDRILAKYTGRTGMHLDVVKRELSKAGVVIRVERELPDSRKYNFNDWREGWYKLAQEDMLKANCGFFEPLIEDNND